MNSVIFFFLLFIENQRIRRWSRGARIEVYHHVTKWMVPHGKTFLREEIFAEFIFADEGTKNNFCECYEIIEICGIYFCESNLYPNFIQTYTFVWLREMKNKSYSEYNSKSKKSLHQVLRHKKLLKLQTLQRKM